MDLHDAKFSSRLPYLRRSPGCTVLWVGELGQGCGLSSDIVATAASRQGWRLKRSSSHAMRPRADAAWSIVQLQNDLVRPNYGYSGFDLLVAFDMAAGARWLEGLRPGGIAWFHRPSGLSRAQHSLENAPRIEPFNIRWFGDANFDEPGRLLTLVTCLGLISNNLPLAQNAWQESIVTHVPADRLAPCWAAFCRGQRRAMSGL